MDNITINIAGDFYLPKIDNWTFESSLKEIIDKGDINVINLEAPLRANGCIPEKKSGPSLYQDEKVPEWLEGRGFNVVNCANNHINDFGEESILYTTKAFSSNATILGVGSFNEAYTIKIIKCKDKRIGFLSITQYEFGVHDDIAYSINKIAAAWMCHPSVTERIKDAHKICDVLIVLPHAGLENFAFPLPELRTLYRHFINMGADAVVASHPHVVQPWEEYNGKYIYYSLGNFCFDFNNKNVNSDKGIIVQLQISNDNSFKVKTIPTIYNRKSKIVGIYDEDDYNIFLKNINIIFKNEKEYINQVNSHCLQLKPKYDMLLSMGGYHKINTIRKAAGFLKQQIKAILKRKPITYNNAHFINSIRCETHRWVLSRIYEV